MQFLINFGTAGQDFKMATKTNILMLQILENQNTQKDRAARSYSNWLEIMLQAAHPLC